MENLVYVVVDIAKEKVLTVVSDWKDAERAASIAQKLGADEHDISITPMKVNMQYGDGTDMCYDYEEVSDTLTMMEQWEDSFPCDNEVEEIFDEESLSKFLDALENNFYQ